MGIKKSLFSAGCGFNIDVENCWCCPPLPQAMVLERLGASSPLLTTLWLVWWRSGKVLSFLKKKTFCAEDLHQRPAVLLGGVSGFLMTWKLVTGFVLFGKKPALCALIMAWLEFTPSHLPWAACKSNWIFLLWKQCLLVNSCIWILSTLGYWMEIGKNCTF